MENTWNFTPAYNSTASAVAERIEDWIPDTFYETLSRIGQKRKTPNNGKSIVFKPVDKNALELIRSFISKSSERSVDYSLGGLFMWIDYFHYEYALFKGALILKGIDPATGECFIQLPLDRKCMTGDDFIQELKSELKRNGENVSMVLRYREISAEEIASSPLASSEFAGYSFGKEYLYPIEQFEFFKGRKMEKKRNHLNYFMRNYPDHTVETISEENLEELAEFAGNLHAGDVLDPLAAYEISQTVEMIRNYLDFGFTGILIRNEGKIIGFTFGEAAGDTFFVHVEKGDTSVHGVYQALSSLLAKKAAEDFPEVRFLNREEDMGDESLAKSKESYHPSSYIYKRYYTL